MKAKKIVGVNLGNWLVLEKWMEPKVFENSDAEDETWLARLMEQNVLKERMKWHRETYVTEEDFANIAAHNLIRFGFRFLILFLEIMRRLLGALNMWTGLLNGQKNII